MGHKNKFDQKDPDLYFWFILRIFVVYLCCINCCIVFCGRQVLSTSLWLNRHGRRTLIASEQLWGRLAGNR